MIDFEQKFRNCVGLIAKYGEEYAQAKAQSWYLQEMRKVILADLTKNAEGKSMAEKETNSRASKEYITHLEGTKEAIYNELKARAMLDKANTSYESLRSLASQQTSSMRLGG
jgi:hypothetical protein